MLVKHAKSGLSNYKPTTEIVIAWWDKAWFEEMLDRKLTNDEYENVVSVCEKSMEYLDLGDSLVQWAEQALAEMNDEVPA